MVCGLSGCGPTYPKERFKESILKVCKDEYKLDVKVDTIGKTIAIYVPLSDLMDFTFAITKHASEKINDVILSVSRVALSSDANFDFYCVIAHDVRVPEIQIVIIKSVDDVKRFMLNDISRNEYFKRMLIDLRLNPQSQKEYSIKQVFEKMGFDPKWQDEVMNDFFRSAPAALGDIGYWGGRFYVKDISLAEFLAEQIASRVKIEFKEEKALEEAFSIKSAKGSYLKADDGKHYFRLETLAESKYFNDAETEESSDIIFRAALKVASDVIHGYRFGDFDYVEIINQRDGKLIRVSKDDLEAFRKKKVKFEELTK